MMMMKKETDSKDNTRPDALNNYKIHLCICEKTDLFRIFANVLRLPPFRRDEKVV